MLKARTCTRVMGGLLSSLIVLSLLFIAAPRAYAQQQTGELTGRITDKDGAAILGATVTVSNPARGIKTVVTTDARGTYVVPLLPPADGYVVTASKYGFTEQKRPNITLQVAQVAEVNLSMSVGSVSESVIVTGAPPLLDAQTSSLGQVIPRETVENLPLNGRSSFRLIALSPGVMFNPAANGQNGDIPNNTTFDEDFSINGGQDMSNAILIDGTPATTGYYNQVTTVPDPDATEEFRVLSNNLPAQYGRFGGGVINVTTKSGTNNLHGTLFEYFRNNVFNADDYFARAAGVPTPYFNMHQFGAAIGGPVVLPRIYNGRNKTFFFGDYQGTSRVQGAKVTMTVPTALEREGDFSQTRNAAGKVITIYDPFSTVPDSAHPGQYIRTAFQGNRIPSDRIDPVAKAILNYIPLPNVQGNPVTNANNWFIANKSYIFKNEINARIDHIVNDHYRFFARFASERHYFQNANSYYPGDIASTSPGDVGRTLFHNYTFAFDHTITLNPTLLMTVNYGFARWYQLRRTLSYGFDNSSLGFPSQFVNLVTIPMFPHINVPGYFSTNSQSFLSNGNDTHSLLISLTKVAGRHTIMVGTDVRTNLINFFNSPGTAGVYNFAIAQTQGPNPNTANKAAGNAFASFLLGTGSDGSMPVSGGSWIHDWYMAAYVQDDFQASSKLTLNLGLRYETETPYVDRQNHLNYFSPTVTSPAANPSFPNLTGGVVFAQKDSRAVYDWNPNQFGPRVGFSYSLFHNTVVRGGIGKNYAPMEICNNAVGCVPNTGYSSSTHWATSLDGGLTPYNVLNNPYPQGLVQPDGNSLGAGTALGQSITVWEKNAKTPQNYQWNFGIQQQLPGSIAIEAAYSGSRGLHLAQAFDYDALDPKYLSMGTALQTQVANPFQPFVTIGALSQPKVAQSQLLMPFPQFTDVTAFNTPWGSSNYQSGQFKASRQAHGLDFLVAYTISKWISNVMQSDTRIGGGSATSPQNWYDLKAERSLTESDAPQNLMVNVVYELPMGHGHFLFSHANAFANKLVSGWRTSGILTERSGFPLAFSASVAGGGNRPNLVPGVSPKLPSSRSKTDRVAEWFNTDAFAQPSAFTFGDVPRLTGAVRAPGMHNLDFAGEKETQITERVRFQFRADIFNFTNTAHFNLPNTNIAAAAFGRITATLLSPPAREVQFAAKLVF